MLEYCSRCVKVPISAFLVWTMGISVLTRMCAAKAYVSGSVFVYKFTYMCIYVCLLSNILNQLIYELN
jgi:hypothetical protein